MNPQILSDDLRQRIGALNWYHTMELGEGVVTNGFFDLRPDVHRYRLPEDLTGKTVLDVGAASGFFSFEFERRGATVTAIDLPSWKDHDHGPRYWMMEEEKTRSADINQEFELAREALGSRVEKKLLNIYDISPDTVGMFDIVFCGSMILHLTNPIKAIWNLASVTREMAIIATSVLGGPANIPCALFQGQIKGDAWWVPTQACLEAWVATSTFEGVQYIGDYHPIHKGEAVGPLQGIIHAYKTRENWPEGVKSSQSLIEKYKDPLGDAMAESASVEHVGWFQKMQKRLGL